MSESWQVPDFLRSILDTIGYGTASPLTGNVPLYDYEAATRHRVAKKEAPKALLSRLGIDENTVAEQAALIEAEDKAKKPPGYITAKELNLGQPLEGPFADYMRDKRLYDALSAEKFNHPMHIVSDEAASKRHNLINEAKKIDEEISNNLLANDLLIRAKYDNPTTRVVDSTNSGLAQGSDAANRQNATRQSLLGNAMTGVTGGIKTLLGEIDWEKSAKATLGNMWDTFTNPAFSAALMQPGISPMQAIAGGIGAARANEAAVAEANRKARLEEHEAETKRIKAQGTTPPKLTAEVNKMYDRIESSRRISRIGNKIKKAIESNPFTATGGSGEIAKAFRGMAAMFGGSPEMFITDDVQMNIAKLKGEVLKSKAFGREASRQELEEILNKILAAPDMFTTSTQMLNSVDSMMRDAERDIYNTTARLKAYGLHTSTEANPMSMPDKYFKRNNPRAN
jgi:hypothetical protein